MDTIILTLTLAKKMTSPDAYDAQAKAATAQFVADVRELKTEALSTLRELLHENDASVRLKAAEAILKV